MSTNQRKAMLPSRQMQNSADHDGGGHGCWLRRAVRDLHRDDIDNMPLRPSRLAQEGNTTCRTRI